MFHNTSKYTCDVPILGITQQIQAYYLLSTMEQWGINNAPPKHTHKPYHNRPKQWPIKTMSQAPTPLPSNNCTLAAQWQKTPETNVPTV